MEHNKDSCAFIVHSAWIVGNALDTYMGGKCDGSTVSELKRNRLNMQHIMRNLLWLEGNFCQKVCHP